MLRCWLVGHDWTNKADQGIKPHEGEDFGDYARMYCNRCGGKYR